MKLYKVIACPRNPKPSDEGVDFEITIRATRRRDAITKIVRYLSQHFHLTKIELAKSGPALREAPNAD